MPPHPRGGAVAQARQKARQNEQGRKPQENRPARGRQEATATHAKGPRPFTDWAQSGIFNVW